jgi:hypothetical protein
VTPTRTLTPIPIGADVTYAGVATLSGVPRTPVGTDTSGHPVYPVVLSRGFFLIVEAKKGPSGSSPATSVFDYDPNDPAARPAFQIESSRPLGANPSAAVCDAAQPKLGGVPAVNPPSFDITQPISDVLNDLGCRFSARTVPSEACTGSAGSFFFVDSTSKVQFCAVIGSELAFPSGDTLLTMRVRDQLGNPGVAKAFVIRAP